MTDPSSFDFLQSAEQTLQLEQQAITHCQNNLDHNFVHACRIMLNTKDNGGRVIVTGMGKSGHIANKIAATLASTGTPAFSIHPGEASHGDLGMVTKQDAILALSNSGTSQEILQLLPLFKRMNVKLISITGNPDSVLARSSDAHINSHVPQEACPLDLAPTASTTASLALGDALAIAMLKASGFSAEEFAFSHPGGALGRKLLLKVGDIMQQGLRVPSVKVDALLPEALLEITSKGLGMTTITDAQQSLLGVFTDGDLRRLLSKNIDIRTIKIGDIMQTHCLTISADTLAVEALNMIEANKVTSLIVSEDKQHIDGIIHLHDILEAGIT